MTNPLRLCLVLHNHQPIGNFDHVFEQAFRDSYLPFLNVFEEYADLSLSLHTSGPLAEWLDAHHSDYFDRLAKLTAEGRLEIVGGAFYEPILTMIPSRDRVGQITEYTKWLENRLGGRVRGMWMPERVWEPGLASDLARANIEYTLLDDFHFRNAGLADENLHGYYVTEDDGRLVSVFPGSERLRYTIPFADPHESIDYLRAIADKQPNAVVVFGDDGEKLGSWPETHRHVYEDGWLRRFFDSLVENRDWLHTTTLSEALDNVPPLGKIYLPESSYREMTEWALPVDRQVEYENVKAQFEAEGRWDKIQRFVRGGFWRNFRVKYSEANDMYSRTMMVSNRLEELQKNRPHQEKLDQARKHLYRAQCNCTYWHGAFGGVYLPHLRNAVYHHLIAADNLLDQIQRTDKIWVEATADDYNFDARREVRLENNKLVCLLAPAAGGQVYELDVRAIRHNLLATMMRRPEIYHRRILGAGESNGHVASIHKELVFKQEGLDRRIQFDSYPRRAFIDHFYDEGVSLSAMAKGEATERGDFATGVYEARIRRSAERVQVVLTRDGNVNGHPMKIIKSFLMNADDSSMEVAYEMEGLPADRSLHFAVEINLAGLPAGADDRYFHQNDQRLGHLGTQLNLSDQQQLALTDEWLGIDVSLSLTTPAGIWTFPVETVSQSEGGFELVHQSTAVTPHWIVRGDEQGRWGVCIRLTADTSRAEQKSPRPELAATT